MFTVVLYDSKNQLNSGMYVIFNLRQKKTANISRWWSCIVLYFKTVSV